MKDITTEEAIEKIKKFIKILKCFESNCNLNDFDLPYALEKVLNELEKKDKIINAMAEEWFELDSLFMIRGKNIHSEKELKQYFEKKVKDE